MKRNSIFLLLLGLVLTGLQGYGQCPDHYITLRTQAQVNAFPSTCTTPVNLIIEGTGINDLTPLKNVISVGIDLRISGTSVTSLSGLEKLESVGKGFYIERNNSLTNLAGLERLESIGAADRIGLSSFSIGYNDKLTSLQGLDKLKTVAGSFSISNNKLLTDLSGILEQAETVSAIRISTNNSLTSLSTLGELPEILNCEEVLIDYNQNLTDIAAFSTVKQINGTVNIVRNPISSLAGFSNIEVVGGDFRLREFGLESLAGLEKLRRVEGLFQLRVLQSLTSLNALNSLEHYESLELVQLGAVPNLNNFPAPEILEGNLYIAGNKLLVNLSGLSNLKEVKGNVDIAANNIDALNSLNGLNNLKKIGGRLLISSAQTDSNLLSLSALTSLESVGGELNVSGQMLTLSGLENLKEVGGIKLNLGDFYNNANIDALAGIASTSGSIEIQGYLTNLNGLRNITHIGGGLKLGSFPRLIDISGLSKVESIAGTFEFFNTSFSNLTALSNLRTLGGLKLTLSGTGPLSDLSGLSGLTSIGSHPAVGNVIVSGRSNNFISLHGLHNVENIAGKLEIQNSSLINLTGLEKLKSIRELNVYGNNDLEDFTGLNSLETILWRGSIFGNSKIKDLSGLNSLESVDDMLQIYNNNSLLNLAGLSGLTSVNNLMSIYGNNSLVNLQGLESLEFARNVQIYSNPKLESLIGLGPARSRSNARTSSTPAEFQSLQITNNAILSECEAWSVCNYLETKNATVSGNLIGCNTQNQIREACEAALPVTLTSFKASDSEGNTVRLDWTTTEEANASHFDIEHSLTGKEWSKIGEMKAAGEHTGLKSYAYIHTNPPLSVNYYRLRSVDLDGSFTYSGIESIRLGGDQVKELFAYPNPVSDRLYLKAAASGSTPIAKLYNATGREVKARLDVATQSLDVRHLPTGVYLLKIDRGNGVSETFRVVISR